LDIQAILTMGLYCRALRFKPLLYRVAT
jgi:hypothetical protein